MATLKIGMDILAEESVAIDSLTGHGGLFKTPGVGQRYLAAACNAPVTCMETAGETLEDYLKNRVFADAKGSTVTPDAADVEGFRRYLSQYQGLLKAERIAVDSL